MPGDATAARNTLGVLGGARRPVYCTVYALAAREPPREDLGSQMTAALQDKSISRQDVVHD
jgi:hypothetical protein